jgi:hypothetical protein
VLFITLVVSLLRFTTVPAQACSLASCVDGGTEMDANFVVMVHHDGKPLAGVTVEIISYDGDTIHTQSFTTTSDGTARITILPAGEYWLRAELLGISAAYECFHVAQQPSGSAQSRLEYEWGDHAKPTSRVAGKLMDIQPGTGGTPIWNLIHPVSVPISRARLRLQNAITGESFYVSSDPEGKFEFGLVPAGTYVLHVEGGIGRGYETTDVVVEVDPGWFRSSFWFTRVDGGGGSCMGPHLDLKTE